MTTKKFKITVEFEITLDLDKRTHICPLCSEEHTDPTRRADDNIHNEKLLSMLEAIRWIAEDFVYRHVPNRLAVSIADIDKRVFKTEPIE